MRKQYKFIKHSKTDSHKGIINKTMLNIAVFNAPSWNISHNFVKNFIFCLECAVFWHTVIFYWNITFAPLPINDNSALTLECIVYGKGWFAWYLWFYNFALFSKFALLRSQIWKRVTFALFVRISAMQINRFTKIVIFVTSLGFSFLSCIALFGFVSFAFLLFILLALLECAWGVSPLRRRFSGATRPPKNPLASWAQLDQLMGFAWYLRPRRNTILQLTANFKPPP